MIQPLTHRYLPKKSRKHVSIRDLDVNIYRSFVCNNLKWEITQKPDQQVKGQANCGTHHNGILLSNKTELVIYVGTEMKDKNNSAELKEVKQKVEHVLYDPNYVKV